MSRHSEPILNVPSVIAGLVAAFAFIHFLRSMVLTAEQNVDFLLAFAFIPARYAFGPAAESLPGGAAADVWTFVSYAFIHGDLTHLGINVLWMLPFGSAVARRFGSGRCLGFFAATAAAGAALHLVTHDHEFLPMIGASAAISGFMAAAIRFVFEVGGPLGVFRAPDDETFLVPAAPLSTVLQDGRILAFLIVWFGLNILFGLGSVGMLGVDQPVAWQAHIGGFLAGLLLFPLFDPVPAAGALDVD